MLVRMDTGVLLVSLERLRRLTAVCQQTSDIISPRSPQEYLGTVSVVLVSYIVHPVEPERDLEYSMLPRTYSSHSSTTATTGRFSNRALDRAPLLHLCPYRSLPFEHRRQIYKNSVRL